MNLTVRDMMKNKGKLHFPIARTCVNTSVTEQWLQQRSTSVHHS